MVNKKWVQIFAIWISVIAPYCARGQDTGGEHDGLIVGAKLGPSLNQFSQPGSFIGFNVGAFAKYPLLDFLHARIEVLYSLQGGKIENYVNNYDENLIYFPNLSTVTHINPYVTFSTVEVPLLLELGLPELKGGAIEPKLILGGSYGFAFSAYEHYTKQFTFTDGTTVNSAYQRDNVGSHYYQHTYSLIAGMGINYHLGKRTFSTEIRYRQGLNQLNQVNYAIPSIGGHLYSSSLTFNFGMTLFNF